MVSQFMETCERECTEVFKKRQGFQEQIMTAPDQFQVFRVLVSVDRGYCSLCIHHPEI